VTVVVGTLQVLSIGIAVCAEVGLPDAHELKKQALLAFEQGDAEEAIELLMKARNVNSGDAEVHYYLGRIKHYLYYDIKPRSFTWERSDSILCHLRTAVSLDQQHGNAVYFIGSEYGVRFQMLLTGGDVEGGRRELRLGRSLGGYPDWMLEYGRNVLLSCDRGAILFAGGDSETIPLWYLQFVEGYRKDITVIPVGLLDYPPFLVLLKQGIEGQVPAVPVRYSKEELADLQAIRRDAGHVRIRFDHQVLADMKLSDIPAVAEWELAPDHEDESGSYLGSSNSLIFSIIQDNAWVRPVNFTVAAPPFCYELYDQNLQQVGLVQRLLPVHVRKHGLKPLEIEHTELVIRDAEHYQELETVKDLEMPRCTPILQNYRATFLRLVIFYVETGDTEEAAKVLAEMESCVPEEVLPVPDVMAEVVETLRRRLSTDSE
jgi:hypothetical protein